MAEPQVTANAEQRLFVITTGSGHSCYGFDNCYRDSVQLAEKLNRPDLMPTEEGIGTMEQYENYRTLLNAARNVDLGTWFTPGTPKQVQDILERYLGTDDRVRILYGDPETGTAWDDREMSGTIGRSTGITKIPLLIRTRRSLGGDGLLTDCIVRIRHAASGQVIYQHPNFQPMPQEAKEEEPEVRAPGM